MPKKQRCRTLTVFLMKEGVTASSAVESRADLVQLPVKIQGNAHGTLYVRPSTSRPPGWLGFFRGAADFTGLNVLNSSTASVFFLPIRDRLMALTFGYGWKLLSPGTSEENFGLKVTLNSVREDSLRSVDTKTLDSVVRHTRISSSRGLYATGFGLDLERDFLRGATGTPADESLGRRMTGMDSLSFSAAMTLEELPNLLEKYLEKSEEKSYREKYPGIENVAEVRDRKAIEDLDALLDNALQAKDYEKLWLAVPEQIDWTDVAGFRYHDSAKASQYEDISLEYLLNECPDMADQGHKSLRWRKVYVWSAQNDCALRSWTVYQCLCFEATYEEKVFILSYGKWYRADPIWTKEVDDYCRGIPRSSLSLPDYKQRNEDEYIESLHSLSPARYAIMHKRLIRHGGSPIEFCDLFSDQNHIIHIKRYGGSSVLSHGFMQGLVSGQCFLLEPRFRAEVNAHLPQSHKLGDTMQRPAPSKYEIVFAIISKSETKELTFPFFSRVTLMNTVRLLEGYQYKVTLKKVNGS